jgi:hypothetical protein
MPKRDNSVRFADTAWGFVAGDASDKSIIVVNRMASSRSSDNRKWAAIRVWAAGQWIDITATPTTVRVNRKPAAKKARTRAGGK